MSFCNTCGARSESSSHFCPKCGAPLFAVMAPHDPSWEATAYPMMSAISWGYGAHPTKKISLAVLLAALFGPLGLIYSSVAGALYMFLEWCFLVLATCDDWIGSEMVATLIAWPICVAWAAFAASSFNHDRR